MTEKNELTSTGRYSPAVTQQVKISAVRQIVSAQRDLLRKSTERTDLHDVDAVRAAADLYLQHCAEIAALPSFVGLASACGVSRQALYKFLDSHRKTESGRLLEQLRSAFTDARITAADRGVAGETLTIFLLKNGGEGFVDRVELSPVQPNDPMQDLDAEAARQRLLEAIPLEDDDDD